MRRPKTDLAAINGCPECIVAKLDIGKLRPPSWSNFLFVRKPFSIPHNPRAVRMRLEQLLCAMAGHLATALPYSDRKDATVIFVKPASEDDLERDAMRTLPAPESDRLEAHFQVSAPSWDRLQATDEHVASAMRAAAMRIRRGEKILTGLAPVLVAILTLVLAGCAETTDILGSVKAGTLPSTTKKIGKAFDDAFPGGTWERPGPAWARCWRNSTPLQRPKHSKRVGSPPLTEKTALTE